ncbi:MAG: GtrA family protein [Alistipes sp.]|nr:GtrA family protein [Alistipes senegalensis]MCM1250890.1 GtrA family protein [Alistipes sp.]
MPLAEAIARTIDRFYLAPVAALVPRQTFRYVACGGITYGLFDPVCYSLIYNCIVARRFVYLGSFALSPHIAALALAFPCTFFVGFWLNRRVAFRQSPLRTRTQLFRYFLSVGGSILLTYAGMKCFVEVCGLWPTPAKVLTTFITAVYSYFAAKYFTFRHAQE